MAVDTSVAVPALVQWHEAHARASEVMAGAWIPAHAYVETFSVLTRLPAPVAPALASSALIGRFADRLISLETPISRVVEQCSDAGIGGGAVYDALIAAICLDHDATLITRDRRAHRTYHAMGLTVDFLD